MALNDGHDTGICGICGILNTSKFTLQFPAGMNTFCLVAIYYYIVISHMEMHSLIINMLSDFTC